MLSWGRMNGSWETVNLSYHLLYQVRKLLRRVERTVQWQEADQQSTTSLMVKARETRRHYTIIQVCQCVGPVLVDSLVGWMYVKAKVGSKNTCVRTRAGIEGSSVAQQCPCHTCSMRSTWSNKGLVLPSVAPKGTVLTREVWCSSRFLEQLFFRWWLLLARSFPGNCWHYCITNTEAPSHSNLFSTEAW